MGNNGQLVWDGGAISHWIIIYRMQQFAVSGGHISGAHIIRDTFSSGLAYFWAFYMGEERVFPRGFFL